MQRSKQFSILFILLAFALAFVGCKGEEKKEEKPAIVKVKAEPVGKKLPEVAKPASVDEAKDLFTKGPGKLSFIGARNHLRGGHEMQITIMTKPFFDAGFADMIIEKMAKSDPEAKAKYDAFTKASGVDLSKAIEGIGVFGDGKPGTFLVSVKQDITPELVNATIKMIKENEKDTPDELREDKDNVDAVYVLANLKDGSVKAIKDAMEAEATADNVKFKHKKYDEATRVIAGLEPGKKNATGFYFWSGGVILVDFPATEDNLEEEAIKNLYPHVKRLDDISKMKDAAAGGTLPAVIGQGSVMGMSIAGQLDIGAKTVLALEVSGLGPQAKMAEEQYNKMLPQKDELLKSPPVAPFKGLLKLLIDGHAVEFGKDKVSASVTVDTNALKSELKKIELPKDMGM